MWKYVRRATLPALFVLSLMLVGCYPPPPVPSARDAPLIKIEPAVVPADAAVSTPCIDGQPEPIQLLERTPYGLRENHSIGEVSWQGGTGFADWDRPIFMVPPLGNQYQVFLINVTTANLRRYCGTLAEVEAYAVNPNGHILAARDSSADATGNKPPEDEISVFEIDLENGGLKVLKLATNGPDPELVASHVQIVHLVEGAVAASMPTPTPTAAAIVAVEVITQTEGAAAAPTLAMTPAAESAVPTEPAESCMLVDEFDFGWDGMSPWSGAFNGPALLQLGQPAKGEAQEWFNVSGATLQLNAIGGHAWIYSLSCTLEQVANEFTPSHPGVALLSEQDLVDRGWATR